MTGKARVLFVDDEKRVLNSMRGLFRRKFDLFLTTEGAAAVKIAMDNPIDVIVADQRMPGMTGIEVLGKVKELSPKTVRILLTGYADPSAVEGSINVGEVFRFLSKPCSLKVLRETLDLAITAARTTPEYAVPASAVTSKPPSNTVAEQKSPPNLADRSTVAVDPPVLRPIVHPTRPAMNHETNLPQPTRNENSTVFRTRSTDESSSHWQSVTNVVLSAGTAQETRDGFADEAPARAKRVGVVIYTVDAQFAETTIRALPAERNMTLATTLIKVVQAIEREKTGILITDFTSNCGRLKTIIGALKQYLPELVTIVVSDSRDTTDMISLINYGQVFRYLLKPVTPQQLRDYTDAAAVRHLYLLSSPDAIRRHEAAVLSDQGAKSDTLNKFIGSIRELRSRRVDAKKYSS